MFAKAVLANVSHRQLALVLAGSNNTCLDTQVVYISCRNPVFLNLIRNKVVAKKNRFSLFKDILVSYQIQKFTPNMYSVSGKCRSITHVVQEQEKIAIQPQSHNYFEYVKN